MKISFTRFSIVPVVVLQWIAAVCLIHLSRSYQHIFADFRVTLPVLSVLALQATQVMVLVPIAVITTAILVASEALLQSAAFRFGIQMIVLSLWLAFACFCFIALELPLLTLVEKLR
jgi:hypothetical protein